MSSASAKENILKRIRKALSNPVPLPFPASEGKHTVFKKTNEDETVLFAENFSKLQGKFFFCSSEQEFVEQFKKLTATLKLVNIHCVESKIKPFLLQMDMEPFPDLANCDAAITGCEYLVARTGSIVMSTAQQSGRTTSVYAPIHICIAYTSQVVFDIKEALHFLTAKYKSNLPSLITFATGPSRTADIEKTLVTGVHGPKEVYCFLIES